MPLSQWLASVVMRVTKGTLAAKDSRMKLVNEMFGAVCSWAIFKVWLCLRFVHRSSLSSSLPGRNNGSKRLSPPEWSKLSGLRNVRFSLTIVLERSCHHKIYTARNINIFYSLLWLIVPMMISVASFFTYVMTGHQLSVSTAFTVGSCSVDPLGNHL